MSQDHVSTPQEQLSKLFGSYKAEWLREMIFDLFTEPSYFPELKTHRPCVLEGGRGTGKTTVLRGLSYEGQYALSGRDASSIAAWEFVGLYYRVDTNRVTAFKGPELDRSRWTALFAHYFNLLICDLILRFLDWYRTIFPDCECLSPEACRKIGASLHLPDCDTVDALSSALDMSRIKFEAFVNNVGDGDSFPLSMQGAPIGDMTEAVLGLPQFRGKQFFVLVDEYENLEDYQQQVVNTLVKHSTDNFTFKIGVRELGWRQRTTLNPNERLVSPADYVLINIVDKLGGKTFRDFARSVCQDRIERLATGDSNIIRDVVTAFPGLALAEEAERLGVQSQADSVGRKLIADLQSHEVDRVGNLTDLQLFFLSVWSDSHSQSLVDAFREYLADAAKWEQRYKNYEYSLLFMIRRSRRGIRKYYSGWDIFTLLACGNIRYLMELVEQSYLAHLQKGSRLDSPVGVDTQTQTAQSVGKRNLSELEGVSVDGAQLTKLLLGLGRVFQVLASDVSGHAPEVDQFRVEEVREGDRQTRDIDVDKLLKSAVMHLALVRSPGTKPGDAGDTRDYEYMIHPIYSAFFECSHRRKRKLILGDADIVGLVREPRRTIRSILRRHHRSLDDARPLPEQMLLFEGYYEGDA